MEWIAYSKIEPFGEDAAFWRAGMVASTSANIWRGRGQAAFKPADFMPHYETVKPSPAKSSEQMKTTLESIFAAIPKRKPGDPKITMDKSDA